jgi:chromatin modification-related protein VID21
MQNAGGVRVRGLPPDKISQRRDSRHISMIDAMRRLARRRENTIHRQQEGKIAPIPYALQKITNIYSAIKTAAMRKVHADGNPNMPRIKKMTPQEWSSERYQADVKRTLQMQKDLQDREEARRQQAALVGRPVQGQIPLSQQQMAAAAAAAAAQRRNAMGATQNMPQQASVPQANQAARVQNPSQNGMNIAGLTQAQQLQALQNLQQAGRMSQNTDAAQLAALQQRQLQQMGQLPSQTANLVAAHLSPSGGNMQNTHQQQLLAAMQRANFANANALAGMNAMGTSPTSAASNSLNNTILSFMHRIQQSNPHLTADQIRRLATEQVRRQMNQNALAAASGASSVAALAGLPSQQAALAQQHLGLHGQANPQMLAAFAAHAAQQQAHQQVQNVGLGPMATPAQGLAAAVMAQGQQMSNANTNSPTQMYGRPMSVQAQQVAAAHQRMPSGSPGLVPARPESRGGAGTPGLTNGMVRSMSGTASQSPILGGNTGAGVAR